MKFKNIPNEYYITILDRLTRLEPANVRYKRVFDDIINKFVIGIKLKDLSFDDEISIIESFFDNMYADEIDLITPVMKKLEDKYFNYNELSYQYLSTRINLSSILTKISNHTLEEKKLSWLKYIDAKNDIYDLRKKYSLLYPIEKIILCEGETEKILLDSMLKLQKINMSKEGYMLIAAGGKNQVVRKYYSMIDYIKLPIFILLDKDAYPLRHAIESKLRDIDTFYILNCGEFEDLIPKKVIMNAINYIHKNDIHCLDTDFSLEDSHVENISNIYKKYGFGEFKKAHFAQELKQYIESCSKKDDFENSEIVEIAKILSN